MGRTFTYFTAAAVVLTMAVAPLYADTPRGSVNKGISHYNKDEYDKALAEFLAGLEKKPERGEIQFDAGTAYYKLNKMPDAVNSFSKALENEKPEVAAKAWYNLGNSLAGAQKLKEAVGAYKNSLRLKHDDADAKHNLETVLRMMQMQQQQQQNQQSDQDSTKQDQQQQAQADSTRQAQQDSTQQAQADSLQQAQQDSSGRADQNKNEMSEQEAMQLLQAMENDENEAVKDKLRRQFGEPKRAEKDW